MQPCELCGHCFAQNHRIVPGKWGRVYADWNVACLCPNHHVAIHTMMRWYYGGYRGRLPDVPDEVICGYMTDRPFKLFWMRYGRPVVEERLRQEGRYLPAVVLRAGSPESLRRYRELLEQRGSLPQFQEQ